MLVLSTLSALTIRKQSVYEVSCKLMKIMCAGWGEQSPWVPGLSLLSLAALSPI